MVLLLTLLACGTPVTLTSVSPAEGISGTKLSVLGEGIPADATVSLVQGDTVVPLADAEVKGALLVEGSIPPGLAAGAWTVRISAGDRTAELENALTVSVVAEEDHCSGKWKTNAQVSRARRVVVIDRFASEDERETVRLAWADIDRVEYELVKLDDDKLCSTIYFKHRDGRRWAFDDDTRFNLEPRAYKLATAVGRRTTVTRKDVEEDPRPVEEN